MLIEHFDKALVGIRVTYTEDQKHGKDPISYYIYPKHALNYDGCLVPSLSHKESFVLEYYCDLDKDDYRIVEDGVDFGKLKTFISMMVSLNEERNLVYSRS